MIDLSVIIPSFETPELLARCLESVERARRSAASVAVEVILVDNGSRDDSVSRARDAITDLRVFALARNRGFARAVNVGLRASRGRAVLLLNSDCEVEPRFIAQGLALLDAYPECAMLGARLDDPGGKPRRSVHGLPSLFSEIAPEWVVRKINPDAFDLATRAERSSGLAQDLRFVEAVKGAAVFLRATAIEKVGLFDEGFFFFLEETDLCARVAAAGYRVGHSRDLVAVHHSGASSKARDALATRIEFHRSLYRYLEKHSGRAVSIAARILRALRGTAVVVGLGLGAAVSASARRRLPERFGLWVWHLRGCPSAPRLVDALEAHPPNEPRETA